MKCNILIYILSYPYGFHLFVKCLMPDRFSVQRWDIVRRNDGTIDYKKGIITLNPVNIISGKLSDGKNAL